LSDVAALVAALKTRIPDYARDIRLNLEAVLLRSALGPEDVLGIALAAAFAARSRPLVEAFTAFAEVATADAALAAGALMAMNNVWYPYVEMAGDAALRQQRPEPRMQAYASHGGVARARFESFALAASIVGKCAHCVRSHHAQLKAEGMSETQLRDIGRVAAVVHAAALVLAQERAS
jgi:alkyl hydroperoxide reductase subunit D